MKIKILFVWGLSLCTLTVSSAFGEEKKPEVKRTVINFESSKRSVKNKSSRGVRLSSPEASAEAARSRLLSRITANSQQALPE